MAKRLFDVGMAAGALVVLAPLLIAVAILIKLTSPGPVLFRAQRAGRGGAPFTMLKFRSMHCGAASGSAITSQSDSRVFRVGRWIRKTKIDELPQLINVIRGEMSIVGPRPEDMGIVERQYVEDWQRATLSVRPGLASPGSIYNYTHGDMWIDADDPEGSYAREFLPRKLALEYVYVRHQSFSYDLRIIFRTIRTVLLVSSGQEKFPDPPEMVEARGLPFFRSAVCQPNEERKLNA
jgi:lipopolysaccharide/colanic/teichoic acid biosynthesis glycosyltransferase